MEIAGFFTVNWMMSTWWQWKPIGSGPCSSMAAPLYANATKRGRWKEWGHGSGGCCVLDTKIMAFFGQNSWVLGAHEGKHVLWGGMSIEIACQPHPTMAIQMVYGSFWEAKAKEVSEIERKTHLRLCSFVGFIFAEGFLSSPILPNPIVKHQLVWKHQWCESTDISWMKPWI